MPSYMYEAKPKKGGKPVKGLVECESEEALRAELDSLGLEVTRLKTAREPAKQRSITDLFHPIVRLFYPSLRQTDADTMYVLRKRLVYSNAMTLRPEMIPLVVCGALIPVLAVVESVWQLASMAVTICHLAALLLMPVLMVATLFVSCARILGHAWHEHSGGVIFTLPGQRELFWSLFYDGLAWAAALGLCFFGEGVLFIAAAVHVGHIPGPLVLVLSAGFLASANMVPIFLAWGTICVQEALHAVARDSHVGGLVRFLLACFGLAAANVLFGGAVAYGAWAVAGQPQPKFAEFILWAMCATLPLNVAVCWKLLRQFNRDHMSWFADAVSRLSEDAVMN